MAEAMADPVRQSRVLKFGTFELDLAAGDLRKSGRKVRLQEQPFRLLAALAERPGEVVTRVKLKDSLWPGDTYVDFDRSLNTAASKLRDALGDSASNPRFIETLPRRGYRFLASVESGGENGHPGDTERLLATAISTADATGVAHRRLRIALALSLVLLCAAAVGIAALWLAPRDTANREQPVRFSFQPEYGGLAVISPNGRHIAYVDSSRQGLLIRDLDREEPRRLEGTKGSTLSGRLSWSPDSKFIAFASGTELKRVPVEGGPVITLCKLPSEFQWNAAWSPDGGTIVLSAGRPRKLYGVPAEGGELRLLLADLETESLSDPVRPRFLPLADGRRVLLFNDGLYGHLVMLDVDSGQERTLTHGEEQPILYPVYSPSGHLLYRIGAVLWALPFSLEALDSTGEAFPVSTNNIVVDNLSVSGNGTLVYQDGQGRMRRLVWRDRSGNELGTAGQPQQRIAYPALSPDETRIAVMGAEKEGLDIWIHDTQSEMKTRLTFHPGNDLGPIWSPSGTEIALTSSRNGSSDILSKAADGSGQVEPLLVLPQTVFLSDWSMDGMHLLHDQYHSDTQTDVWYLTRKPDGAGFDSTPFLATKFDERAAKFSPDGRYVVYISDESGERQVYVRPFPDGDNKWQISHSGGTQPRWRRDGRELFFVEGSTLFAVPVSLNPSFSAGTPTKLFESPLLLLRQGMLAQYDVTADGQRFVTRESVGGVAAIHVVENWFAEFKDRQQDR